MVFRKIGNGLFLEKNEDLSHSLKDDTAEVEIIVNGYSGEGKLLVCAGDGELLCSVADTLTTTLTLKDNTDYTIHLTDENNVFCGRFSVLNGVVCYNPDVLPLEFGIVKNALVALAQRIDVLETETADVEEILNGYTTE